MSISFSTIKLVGGTVLLVAVAGGGYIAYDILSKPKPVGSVSAVAAPAPAIRKAPTKKVVIKKPVRAFVGDTQANLKLPAAVRADPNNAVIAATQAPSSLRPTTTSTVVNTETGEVTTFVKTDPYPWLSYEPRGEIRMAYGYKYSHVMHQSAPVGRLQVTYDVLRVKALTLGVQATVDSDSTAFAGVGVSYKW